MIKVTDLRTPDFSLDHSDDVDEEDDGDNDFMLFLLQ